MSEVTNGRVDDAGPSADVDAIPVIDDDDDDTVGHVQPSRLRPSDGGRSGEGSPA
jgi:hypothetical protein